MRRLLGVIRNHADAVEADLSRYHHIDYRDRWRFNEDGTRKLTLRMIAVRLRHLPLDSATAIAEGSGGWTVAHYLQAHAVEVQTGKPHPWTPTPGKELRQAEKDKARTAALKRKKERDRLIAEGLI